MMLGACPWLLPTWPCQHRSRAAGLQGPFTERRTPYGPPGHRGPAGCPGLLIRSPRSDMRRATYVPYARVIKGKSRSLTGTCMPLTSTSVSAAHPAGRTTDLPSWSCRFDPGRPLQSCSATPVGVGPVPDVNDENLMLPVVDLIENTPIPHEARAPDAIQRGMERLPQPLRVTDQWPGYEVHSGDRHIRWEFAGDRPPGWRSESYLKGISGLSHVAHRARRAPHRLLAPHHRARPPHAPRSVHVRPLSLLGLRRFPLAPEGSHRELCQPHAHDHLGRDAPHVHAPPNPALCPRGEGYRQAPPRSSRTRVRSCI